MPQKGITKDENKHPLPPLSPQRGRVRVGGWFYLRVKQKYLKFPLTLPLSPFGEREGVRGFKMLEEISQIQCVKI
jgi:hypothetical protein